MEALELSVKKDYLPINLRDEETGEIVGTLKFQYDDSTTKSFQKDSDIILKRIEDLEKEGKAETETEDMILEEWFDYVLGEGSYEIIKKHQRSIINRKTLLIELTFLIRKALSVMKNKQDEEAAKLYEIAK